MDSITELTQYHKALGEPTRLRIVAILATGSELRVSEIVEILEMGQSRISRHLRILADAGIVTQRKSGTWTFCALAKTGASGEMLSATLPHLYSPPADATRTESVLAQRKDETIRFFEDVAADWDELKRRVFDGIDPDEIAASGFSDSGVVADLGCGNARLAELLSSRGIRVIGVDNAPAMVANARNRHHNDKNIEFRLGDVEHLPLRDDEVDGAALSFVLHHLAVPAQAIAEAARVTGPAGRIVVSEFAPHDDERLRETHGDRWLGIEETQVVQWMEQSRLRVTKIDRQELKEHKQMYTVHAVTPTRR